MISWRYDKWALQCFSAELSPGRSFPALRLAGPVMSQLRKELAAQCVSAEICLRCNALTTYCLGAVMKWRHNAPMP